MSPGELDAAGINDPDLRAAYDACRRISEQHGRTYYLATRLLPAGKRPAVHALYAFARQADEIVDEMAPGRSLDDRRGDLTQFIAEFRAGGSDRPVLRAVRDTIERHDIDAALFDRFLASMLMDLSVTDYADFDDLMRYVDGSAAVIGLQMLPVLGTVAGMRDVAAPYALDLGIGFQLTNFIRDVGEDLQRGRLYLPVADLEVFGVTRADLEAGVVTGAIRRLLAFEISRAREFLRNAQPGIRLIDPTSRDCVHTARVLYGGILDEVERSDYRVMDRRVSVGLSRRAVVAVPGLLRAWRARRPHHTHQANV